MPEVASKIESKSTELKETCSPISITDRKNKQLIDRFAPEFSKQVRHCATQLISYFKHWHKWKEANYPTPWVYQPLKKIRHDLMDIFTVHVIRAALDLLEKLGFLSIRKNARDLNNRNGQDRTHQYLLNSDRIEALKKELSPRTKAETPEPSPFVNNETPRVSSEIPRFTVETYTQIPSIDSCINSYSLLEEQERKLDFVQEEEIKDPWTVEEDELDRELLELFNNAVGIVKEQKTFGKDHFSAPAEPELIKTVEASTSPSPEPKCSEVIQTDLKPLPKVKSDRPSGFRSDTERDGFYQELLELGRTQGKNSPVAWASAILKSINAGEPCQYLTEYREGQQVGSSEKQEWEIAPGQPHNQFLTYLKTRIKKAEMTDEQAIVTAHQQLKNVNLARSLWESFKRCIVNRRDDWEQQKQLGVQNAYLPSELLPEREVSLEQAAGAIASLQAGSVQLQGLPESVAIPELEPAQEVSTDSEPEVISLVELQEKLNLPLKAPLARMMARNVGYRIEEDLVLPGGEGMPCLEHLRSLMTNPINARKVERLIAAHPEWGFWIDKDGEIQDF
jgi:hypothetical protein